jgi:predicted metal-dependent hydrolase
MAQKTVVLPDIGEVILVKRRGTKNLRLTIQPNGKVRVGLPFWAPYSAAIHFANQRSEWIRQNSPDQFYNFLEHGQNIGKSFILQFIPAQENNIIKTRLRENLIIVSGQEKFSSAPMQKKATQACERALKKEAQVLLAPRLNEISTQHKLPYKQIKIKRMLSRWGSCSQDGTVTLNYFLVQLPWPLIDYVLVHELAHTKHLNHSRDFWNYVESILPNAKTLRKEIKAFRPILMPG